MQFKYLMLGAAASGLLVMPASPAIAGDDKPGSAYVQCDGQPDNVTDGETAARLLGAVTLLGLFAPPHEAADSSKRKFGAEGVAACTSLLSGDHQEGNAKRRLGLMPRPGDPPDRGQKLFRRNRRRRAGQARGRSGRADGGPLFRPLARPRLRPHRKRGFAPHGPAGTGADDQPARCRPERIFARRAPRHADSIPTSSTPPRPTRTGSTTGAIG